MFYTCNKNTVQCAFTTIAFAFHSRAVRMHIVKREEIACAWCIHKRMLMMF